MKKIWRWKVRRRKKGRRGLLYQPRRLQRKNIYTKLTSYFCYFSNMHAWKRKRKYFLSLFPNSTTAAPSTTKHTAKHLRCATNKKARWVVLRSLLTSRLGRAFPFLLAYVLCSFIHTDFFLLHFPFPAQIFFLRFS